MSDSVSISIIAFVFVLGLFQAYDAYRRDQRKGALAIAVALVIAAGAGSADMYLRDNMHTSLLGSISGNLQSYETNNDKSVASLSFDAEELKHELQDVRDLASQLSDEIAKIDIERLQGSFPVSDRWARDDAKGVSASGMLSWPARYGLAVGAAAAGMQRVSVRYRDLRDPFVPPFGPQQVVKTYAVATTYGIAHLVGDRYEVRFASKRVPHGPMLEIDRPTNVPHSAHIKVQLDGDDSGIDNEDLAFVPDAPAKHR